MFGHGQAAGQIGVGEGAGRQGPDAGAFGGGADDFRVKALSLDGLWIDFERASGDEIKPAATGRGKALHIVKSGQHPKMKGRDDLARIEGDRPGVFIDEQVWHRPDAKGLEQVPPSRGCAMDPVGDLVLGWSVANLVGAAGQHYTAARFEEGKQLPHVLGRGDLGLDPKQHVDCRGDGRIAVEIELDDRPGLVEKGRQKLERRRGRHAKGRLRRLLPGLQLGDDVLL